MSTLEGYVEYAGVELANPNRTLAYLRALGGSSVTVTAEGTCECDTIAGDYVQPDADPAPWYDGGVISSEFLGVFLTRVSLTPAFSRELVEDADGGGRLGPLRRRSRILQVRGSMYATSSAGMRVGERFIEQTLAGSGAGCADDEIRVLPACPGEFRRLLRAGIIDGPVFEPVSGATGCRVQEVSFQLAAGVPYLQSEPLQIMPSQQLNGLEQVCFTAISPGRTGVILTIEAGSAAIEGVTVYFEPCDGGYETTYSEFYGDVLAGSLPYVEFDAALEADQTLIVDASSETIRVYDTAGRVVGGADATAFRRGFYWMQALNGAAAAVYVDARTATVNSATSVTVATVDME